MRVHCGIFVDPSRIILGRKITQCTLIFWSSLVKADCAVSSAIILAKTLGMIENSAWVI